MTADSEEAPTCIYEKCKSPATWLIIIEIDDDYIELRESCLNHVGHLLDPDGENMVFPIDGETEDGPSHKGTTTVSEIQSCPLRFKTAPVGERMHGMDQWSFNPPEAFQRCSYCNSINPEDAISLIEAGWHLERSSRAGEFYLLPDKSKSKNTRLKGSSKVMAHHCSEQQTLAMLTAAYGGTWVRNGDHFEQIAG